MLPGIDKGSFSIVTIKSETESPMGIFKSLSQRLKAFIALK